MIIKKIISFIKRLFGKKKDQKPLKIEPVKIKLRPSNKKHKTIKRRKKKKEGDASRRAQRRANKGLRKVA